MTTAPIVAGMWNSLPGACLAFVVFHGRVGRAEIHGASDDLADTATRADRPGS